MSTQRPDVRGRTPRRLVDRGEANLQYVVAFPALLLLIGVMTQAAWWYAARNAALAAAQEGVRAARAQNAVPETGRATAVRFAQEVAGGQLRSPGATVSSDGKTVVVRVTGRVWSFVPGLDMQVSQVARGAKERFTTPSGP